MRTAVIEVVLDGVGKVLADLPAVLSFPGNIEIKVSRIPLLIIEGEGEFPAAANRFYDSSFNRIKHSANYLC